MNTPAPDQLEERMRNLWLLVISPVIWAAHFSVTYATVAIWCAKVAGRDGPLGSVRWTIAIYTIVALTGIAIAGWRGHGRHRYDGTPATHDFDTRVDRHRFLGYATFLLSGLSAVATIFSALVAVFFEDCR